MRRLALALAWGLLAAAPAAAAAGAIPGATYTGTGSDGASLTFTVSSSGTTVTSYTVLGIFGTDANGQTCQGTVSLNSSGWSGAPISDDAFQDSSISDFSIAGAFDSGVGASGTFDLDEAPLGASAGCSTGSVTWTATTTSSGGGGGTSSGSGAGSSGSMSGSSVTGTGSAGVTFASARSVKTRVRVRRLGAVELGGSVTSSSRGCASRRTVYLWSGRRLLATHRANRRGTFTFLVPRAWRGSRLHVTVRGVTVDDQGCAAAASVTVKG